MIFGRLDIHDGKAIETHRDTYLLPRVSVVSVRRPFFTPAIMAAGGVGGFATVFHDLLYAGEIAICIGFVFGVVAGGFHLAQLQLLSRDLKGTELTDAVWGTRATLETKRREIVSALHSVKTGEGS